MIKIKPMVYVLILLPLALGAHYLFFVLLWNKVMCETLKWSPELTWLDAFWVSLFWALITNQIKVAKRK